MIIIKFFIDKNQKLAQPLPLRSLLMSHSTYTSTVVNAANAMNLSNISVYFLRFATMIITTIAVMSKAPPMPPMSHHFRLLGLSSVVSVSGSS